MVSTRSSGAAIHNGLNGNSTPRKRTRQETADPSEKRPRLLEKTDVSRWRMRDEAGCHTWHYLEDDDKAREWPQTIADKYYLGLDLVSFGFAVSPFAADKPVP